MVDPSGQAVGLPWFSSKDYAEALHVMADARMLPKSYDQWLLEAEQFEASLIESGQRPVRVEIDPHGFVAWCIFHDMDADSVARQRFAAYVAAEDKRARGRKKFER